MCLAIAIAVDNVQKRGLVRGGRASFARFRAGVSLHLVQERTVWNSCTDFFSVSIELL